MKHKTKNRKKFYLFSEYLKKRFFDCQLLWKKNHGPVRFKLRNMPRFDD